ncbi:unnamed protein product [Calicophoron daubneyi]|uniref:C2H2-type domain-containing protein n=1 Tax=Calicophoron daubneyi TaxID=300641 RepID=A0AAV2TE38_CALDB
MPRFKATPQQFFVASDSEETESDGSSDKSVDNGCAQGTLTVRQEQLTTASVPNLINEGPPIQVASSSSVLSAGCLPTLNTTTLLSQAAAIAVMTTAPPLSKPVQLPSPPIPPLGLPQLPILNVQPSKGENTPTEPGTLVTSEKRPATKTLSAEQKPSSPSKSAAKPSSEAVPKPSKIPHTPSKSSSQSAPKSPTQSALKPEPEPLAKTKPVASETKNKKKKKKSHTDRGFVPCPQCKKSLRRSSLREHMDRHNNSGNFPCSICLKKFSRSSVLEKHMRIHTGERPFRCNLCSNSYKQQVQLNEHMRSHTGTRPFICRLCGFSMASKSLLNRHLRAHGIEENPNSATGLWYKSNVKGEEVVNIAGAVGLVVTCAQNSEQDKPSRHIATALTLKDGSKLSLQPTALAKELAERGRKYLCESCPAGFPSNQSLRSHRITVHGASNPHKCPSCDASFGSYKILAEHRRKKHPQICPLCSKQMPQRHRWVLEVHIRDEHPGVSPTEVIGPNALAKSYPASKSANKSEESSLGEREQPSPTKPKERARGSKRSSEKTTTESRKSKRFRPEETSNCSSGDTMDETAPTADESGQMSITTGCGGHDARDQENGEQSQETPSVPKGKEVSEQSDCSEKHRENDEAALRDPGRQCVASWIEPSLEEKNRRFPSTSDTDSQENGKTCTIDSGKRNRTETGKNKSNTTDLKPSEDTGTEGSEVKSTEGTKKGGITHTKSKMINNGNRCEANDIQEPDAAKCLENELQGGRFQSDNTDAEVHEANKTKEQVKDSRESGFVSMAILGTNCLETGLIQCSDEEINHQEVVETEVNSIQNIQKHLVFMAINTNNPSCQEWHNGNNTKGRVLTSLNADKNGVSLRDMPEECASFFCKRPLQTESLVEVDENPACRTNKDMQESCSSANHDKTPDVSRLDTGNMGRSEMGGGLSSTYDQPGVNCSSSTWQSISDAQRHKDSIREAKISSVDCIGHMTVNSQESHGLSLTTDEIQDGFSNAKKYQERAEILGDRQCKSNIETHVIDGEHPSNTSNSPVEDTVSDTQPSAVQDERMCVLPGENCVRNGVCKPVFAPRGSIGNTLASDPNNSLQMMASTAKLSEPSDRNRKG